jgi:polar amino acid transport system substrate-binding protein
MNGIIHFQRLILFLLLTFLGTSSQAEMINEISLCEDPWPPYTYGETGEVPEKGYAVEFIKEISKRTGVKINMRLFPWKRCLHMAEKGGIDGIMLLTKNQDRSRYLDFTIPLMGDNNLVWFRSDRNLGSDWNSFSDLKSYRIGLVAGFNYGDVFNAMNEKHTFTTETARSIETNFQKLAADRIDLFFVNLAAANIALSKHPELRAQVTYVDKLFEKVPFYIGLAKHSEARILIPKFNRAIESMLNDGTIDKILSQ